MEVTLRSNRGDSEMVMDLGPAEEYGSERGLASSFRACGQHWDGDHDHELSASIEGFWLRGGDLIAVRDLVAEWARQPLDQLAASELIGDVELARLPDQSLRLGFSGNVAVTISFSCGTFRGEFHFDTDQSCLSLFAQELSSALGKFGIVPAGR